MSCKLPSLIFVLKLSVETELSSKTNKSGYDFGGNLVLPLDFKSSSLLLSYNCKNEPLKFPTGSSFSEGHWDGWWENPILL